MSMLRRGILSSTPAPEPSGPCKELESPGIFGALGAGAMTIDGLTTTNSDGSLQAAHVKSTVSAPSADDRILFEVHYTPADWTGAGVNNYVAIGDVTQGDDVRVLLGDATGQANSALAFAVARLPDPDGLRLIKYASDGTFLDSNTTSLTDFYAQVISEKAGGSVTFVTDKANFIVPVPANNDGTDYDWCGNTI